MIVEHTDTATEVLNNVHEVAAQTDVDQNDCNVINDPDLAQKLDRYSLEAIVDLKISRFLDQIGTYYPESLHALIMRKTEKPLLAQILRRTGGNQVHAARILGINRNTLRKKMKMYGIC
jgi:Fis family transcriptional regulator, factor for inversion stimulation protein